MKFLFLVFLFLSVCLTMEAFKEGRTVKVGSVNDVRNITAKLGGNVAITAFKFIITSQGDRESLIDAS